jgi:hypothetical protein
LTIEPRAVPIFGVTRQYSCRKNDISSPLNGNSTKLETRSIGHLSLAVVIEILSEQINLRLLLKVHFAEDLKVEYIGNRVGTNVLRMKIIKMKNIPEEF